MHCGWGKQAVGALVALAVLVLPAVFVVGALILAYEFAALLLVAALVGLALITLADNVKEIRRA